MFVIRDTGLQVPPVHHGAALDGEGCHDFPHGGRQRDRHHQSDREYPQVLLLFTCNHCSKLPWVVIWTFNSMRPTHCREFPLLETNIPAYFVRTPQLGQ